MKSNKFLITLLCCAGLALFCTGCNVNTSSGGNTTTNPQTSKLRLSQPTSPQSPPYITLNFFTNYSGTANHNVRLVIINTDLRRVVSEVDYVLPYYGSTTKTLDLNAAGTTDPLALYNGKHKVFCFDKDDLSNVSEPWDLQFNQIGEECLSPLRNYRFYYGRVYNYDAIAGSVYELDPNNQEVLSVERVYKNSNILLNKTLRSTYLPNTNLEVDPGQDGGIVLGPYISQNISASEYTSSSYEGLLISINRVFGFDGDAGGATFANNRKSFDRSSIIFCGLLDQRSDIPPLDKPKAKTGSIIHELGHQMLATKHGGENGFEYYYRVGNTSTKIITFPEHDYNHAGCCVLQKSWPGSCGWGSYSFCSIHKCYISKSKWN